MKYLAAYALAWLAGNENPTAAQLKRILESIGAEFDNGQAQGLVESLNGKDLPQVIEAGLKKLSSVPAGVGGAGPAAGASNTAAAEAAPAVEEEEDDALEGGMDLFGGDDW